MKAEFEEQQKKSIFAGGTGGMGGGKNPLQDFDMAAWMVGKTSGKAAMAEGTEGRGGQSETSETSGRSVQPQREDRAGGSGASSVRRRG